MANIPTGEVHLVCVEVGGKSAAQSNKYYKMIPKGDGTFLAKWGRVGGREDSKTYPMSEWNSTYREKTGRKGYKDITELLIEEDQPALNETSATPKIHKEEHKLIDLLQSFAKGSIKKNYTVSSEKVTAKMVQRAQELLDEIVLHVNHHGISSDQQTQNKKLMELYTVIPRKMDDVRNFIFKPFNSQSNFDWNKQLLANEQDTLDVMTGQVELAEKTAGKQVTMTAVEEDILLRMGLQITIVQPGTAEWQKVKDMMRENAHQMDKLYRVENVKTRTAFDNYLKTLPADRQVVVEKFHGSRNENWFNILQAGLLIKPAGVYHTASMYGNAIYHSTRFAKSLNYTSYNGSYYARGNQNIAFIAIHDVLVGKFMNTKEWNSGWYQMNLKKLQEKGYDSVWAEPGTNGLRNDEIMVYQPCQTTVKYLIQIK